MVRPISNEERTTELQAVNGQVTGDNDNASRIVFDDKQDVWLVLESENGVTGTDSSKLAGGLIATKRNLPLPLSTTASNTSVCVKIDGGMVGLRDALLKYLPPEPYKEIPTHQTHSTPPPQLRLAHKPTFPPSPRESVYYPQELSEVKRFELFRQVIEHEDDLLNQRVSWIILAQSFLMAAYVTASDETVASKYIMAGVGLATVLVTLPAIVAAGKNIELQQSVYFQGLDSDDQCLALHGHVRDISQPPTRAEAQNRATKGHIFPNTAFRGPRAMPILSTVLGLAFVQVAGWCLLLLALRLDW